MRLTDLPRWIKMERHRRQSCLAKAKAHRAYVTAFLAEIESDEHFIAEQRLDLEQAGKSPETSASTERLIVQLQAGLVAKRVHAQAYRELAERCEASAAGAKQRIADLEIEQRFVKA